MRGWFKPLKRLCLPKSFGVFGFSVGANSERFSQTVVRQVSSPFVTIDVCRVSSRQPRSFSFGKRTQNQRHPGQFYWIRPTPLDGGAGQLALLRQAPPFFGRRWPKGLASRRHPLGTEIKLKSYTSTVSGILGSAGRDRCLRRGTFEYLANPHLPML
jgi:hypothetical protein